MMRKMPGLRAHGALAVLAFAAAAGGCGGPTSPSNGAPNTSMAISPAGQMIVSVTPVTLTAAGIDPDGDAVTYEWDLGDGFRSTGPTVSHVYLTEGIHAVTLKATDSKGATSSATANVTVRSLTGTWTPFSNGQTDPGDVAQIIQTGLSIVGQSSNLCTSPGRPDATCTHTFQGTVGSPRQVQFTFRFSGCPHEDRTLTGTVNEGLDQIQLTGMNCNVPTTQTFRR